MTKKLEEEKNKLLLSFLGTGAALTRNGRYPSGLVIDKKILIDVPPQAYSHLKKLEIPPENLTHILVTHFHPDHVLGLAMLIQEWMVLENRKKPVSIIGPTGLVLFMNNVLDTFFAGETFDYSKICRYFVIPNTGTTRNIMGLKFEAIPMNHSTLDMGYRVFCGEKVVAVSGDTGMCDQIYQLLESDAAILEMSFVLEPYPYHLNMLEHLIPITDNLKPDNKLFLYHLTDETEDVFRYLEDSKHPNAHKIFRILKKDNVIIAEDLQQYEV